MEPKSGPCQSLIPTLGLWMEDLQKKFKFAGSKLADFVTVRRPDMNQLKWNYSHVQDKSFYMVST